jgi:hypothetical protein
MNMTKADNRLLLADPPTGRISTTCNQCVQRFIAALRLLISRSIIMILLCTERYTAI